MTFLNVDLFKKGEVGWEGFYQQRRNQMYKVTEAKKSMSLIQEQYVYWSKWIGKCLEIRLETRKWGGWGVGNQLGHTRKVRLI